jgi:hypothetical protein
MSGTAQHTPNIEKADTILLENKFGLLRFGFMDDWNTSEITDMNGYEIHVSRY